MSLFTKLLEDFTALDDPRVPGLVHYPLEELLLCALCGILCRNEDWEEVRCWSIHHLKWLRQFLPYKKGIPSVQTFKRVFNALNHKQFKYCFQLWIKNLSLNLSGKQIAIDGKTIKGSKLSSDGFGAAHIVSAYVHEYGLVLGQEKISDKSNEITAIPDLLTSLAIEGSIISIDAMGTQKKIAEQIVNKKGDYILALKQNHPELYSDVKLFLDNIDNSVIHDEYEDTDAGHGRIEVRNCKITSDIDWLKELHPDWKNLRSIVAIDALRINKKTLAEQRQTRYYISSLATNANAMLQYTRNHWSIENKLHWVLDMNFKEDSCRTRVDHGAENFALVRKFAFNLVKLYDPKDKTAIKRKMLKANWDLKYLKNLLVANNL